MINLSTITNKILMLAMLACTSMATFANDEPSPEIPANIITLSKVDPDRTVGFMMGDLLTRDITLTVKKPYKLVPTTLPIVGYEHRYKGQVSGIELRKISKTEEVNRDNTTYNIHLTYQVFATAPTVKPAVLPAEIVKFQGPSTAEAKDGLVQFEIPSFYFRISPMSVFGAVKIEEDMSPLRQPFLLQPYPEKQKLVACLIVLGLSLTGLLYILGSSAWLPLMGKPFAKASRQLRKLKANNNADLKLAISALHQAINDTAKYSVFSDNSAAFLAKSPSFKVIEQELANFFVLSQHAFFDTQAQAIDTKEAIKWLRGFCRQCRDCERGLKPALKAHAIAKA